MFWIVASSVSRRKQSGVALLVALVILLIVSLIGVTAMRSSILNQTIATNARASTMSFQAAEAALAALFTEASDEDAAGESVTNIFEIMGNQLSHGVMEEVERCVVADDAQLVKAGACSDGDRYDGAGFLQASYRLAVNPTPQIIGGEGGEGGSQISRSGEGGALYGSYQFTGVGHGAMPDMDLENFNVQEFSRRGLVPEDEI